MHKTAQDKIDTWLQVPDNLKIHAFRRTYAEIAKELNISISSVSINLPIRVASIFNKRIKWFKALRTEYAQRRHRRGVSLSQDTLNKLKWLRRKKRASLLECAYELGLHYQTVRKHCKRMKC